MTSYVSCIVLCTLIYNILIINAEMLMTYNLTALQIGYTNTEQITRQARARSAVIIIFANRATFTCECEIIHRFSHLEPLVVEHVRCWCLSLGITFDGEI